jgi:hypothetical protein
VYLRYLSDLTPEHQQIWKAREVDERCTLHADYYRSSFLGEWYERISVFDAIIHEIREINVLSSMLGRPNLFRQEFETSNRPDGFG